MPKKVSKSIKQPNSVRLSGGQKQKQSQSVSIRIETPKPKRAPRKSSKKMVSIINTGPVLSTVLSSTAGPAFINNPHAISHSGRHNGLVSIAKDDYPSFVRNTISIPADPRHPIQPIYQPWAYDSGFQQGGSGAGRILGQRPREWDIESDISDITYQGSMPFVDNSIRNSISGLSLETIPIPQQGMGSSIASNPSIESLSSQSFYSLQNAMNGLSQANYGEYQEAPPPEPILSPDEIRQQLRNQQIDELNQNMYYSGMVQGERQTPEGKIITSFR
jgi:hypothetical protein